MKKWILLLPCTLFPYSLLIGLVCFLKGLGNVGEVFGFLPHLFLLSFALSLIHISAPFPETGTAGQSGSGIAVGADDPPGKAVLYQLGGLEDV